MGRKRVLTGAVIIALIISVSGIGRFHSSPFSFSLEMENPTAWGTNVSGTPLAFADQSGTVLMLLDEDGRLQHAIKVNSADHQHDHITLLHAENGFLSEKPDFHFRQ